MLKGLQDGALVFYGGWWVWQQWIKRSSDIDQTWIKKFQRSWIIIQGTLKICMAVLFQLIWNLRNPLQWNQAYLSISSTLYLHRGWLQLVPSFLPSQHTLSYNYQLSRSSYSIVIHLTGDLTPSLQLSLTHFYYFLYVILNHHIHLLCNWFPILCCIPCPQMWQAWQDSIVP